MLPRRFFPGGTKFSAANHMATRVLHRLANTVTVSKFQFTVENRLNGKPGRTVSPADVNED